jgi:hypothetical protein
MGSERWMETNVSSSLWLRAIGIFSVHEILLKNIQLSLIRPFPSDALGGK